MKLLLLVIASFVITSCVVAQQQHQYGINGGYYGWSGQKQNQLYVQAGIQSARMLFPKDFFVQWTYPILIDNHSFNNSLGMSNYVAFLMYNQDAHANNYKLPTSLYEPIWNGDGSLNQNNEWAVFVNSSVVTYKDYITCIEVWNEPDYIDDWRFSLTWWNSPPSKNQLTRFGGDIYSYIRLLRITYEVTKKIKPSIYVTVGGLGYPQFLDAVLRYTDNSADGKTGINYIDAMSTHFYPYLATSKTDSDSYVMAYQAHINSFKNITKNRGFNPKYWVVTETGVSTKNFDKYYGSEDLQRNYFMKLPNYAIINGVSQNHIFVTGDTDNEWFGLFYNFAGKDSATMKDSSKSVLFWKEQIGTRKRDQTKTNQLQAQLPNSVIGHAYVNANNASDVVYLVWANTSSYQYESSTPSVKITLQAVGDYKLIDYTGTFFKASPNSNGTVSFQVDATPILCYDSYTSVEDPDISESNSLKFTMMIVLIVLINSILIL